jgi:galactitol-specific phosphotransferase system IIC component
MFYSRINRYSIYIRGVILKKTNWKLYSLLLIIFIPLAVIVAFLLPGNYKALSFLVVIAFWVVYLIMNTKQKNKKT